MSPRRSISPEPIAYTSNVKVSSKAVPRRDSWDVLNKTKLSESTNTTDLNGQRDNETHRNTVYNKSSALTNGAGVVGARTTTSNFHSSSTKEVNERYVTKQEAKDFSFSSGSRFKPIGEKDLGQINGAKAIKVQDIPDGVLGRPVEFESEFKPSCSQQ